MDGDAAAVELGLLTEAAVRRPSKEAEEQRVGSGGAGVAGAGEAVRISRAWHLAPLALAAALLLVVGAHAARGPGAARAQVDVEGATQQQEVTPCLCLFDVDRTLTGKQGQAGQCPGNEPHPGVLDNAFGGGDLTLSPLGQKLASTFCGQCHLGIVSQGGAGGPDMKAVLQTSFVGAGEAWSGPGHITSPLVIGCADPLKAKCAKGIVDWYYNEQHVDIPANEVYFFDDHTGNTNGFDAFGFNARQVSCASRDASNGNSIGLCGAQLEEIVRETGVVNCPH